MSWRNSAGLCDNAYYGLLRPPDASLSASLVQEAVSKSTSHPVELSIWHRADIVVTAEGYESYKDFTQQTLEERIEKLPEVFEDVAAK